MIGPQLGLQREPCGLPPLWPASRALTPAPPAGGLSPTFLWDFAHQDQALAPFLWVLGFHQLLQKVDCCVRELESSEDHCCHVVVEPRLPVGPQQWMLGPPSSRSGRTATRCRAADQHTPGQNPGAFVMDGCWTFTNSSKKVDCCVLRLSLFGCCVLLPVNPRLPLWSRFSRCFRGAPIPGT